LSQGKDVWGEWLLAPHIPTLNTRWKKVVDSTLRPPFLEKRTLDIHGIEEYLRIRRKESIAHAGN
jgi:hypothetical protein